MANLDLDGIVDGVKRPSSPFQPPTKLRKIAAALFMATADSDKDSKSSELTIGPSCIQFRLIIVKVEKFQKNSFVSFPPSPPFVLTRRPTATPIPPIPLSNNRVPSSSRCFFRRFRFSRTRETKASFPVFCFDFELRRWDERERETKRNRIDNSII